MLQNLAICFYLVLMVSGDTVDTSNLTIAIQSNEKFANNLFKNIENKDKNLVISPLSAQLITEFLRLGSGGNTTKQIQNALNLPESGPGNGFKLLLNELTMNSDTTIRIANRVYVAEKNLLNNDFQIDSNESLMADAVNVDFSKEKTADDINNWIEQKTENKIKNIVEDGLLDGDTSLLLVNTLYFRGFWDVPFDDESRKMFHKNDNESVETDFLDMETVSYDDINRTELPELFARMLDLPYKGKKLRFIIILPDKNSTLKSLEEKMVDINLDDLLNKSETTAGWRVSIPKFKIESSIDLKQAFSKMGMTDMFTGGIADFSKLTTSNTPPLYASDAIQKTFIQVDKDGTEAASASFIKVVLFSAIINPPEPFIADRPFLFYLIHRTTENHSTVLFSGRYTSP